MKRAVFLDKDGTLIEDVPYNVDPASIRLVPNALEALTALSAAGFALVVVSNQSGVARGLFPFEALSAVTARLQELTNGTLLDVLYCPHLPDGAVTEFTYHCACRKPGPGMLQRAAATHRINLAASWMVGDILDDVEAGRRAGCRTILLDPGGETEWRRGAHRHPDHRAVTLAGAARLILAHEQRRAA